MAGRVNYLVIAGLTEGQQGSWEKWGQTLKEVRMWRGLQYTADSVRGAEDTGV